MVRQTVLCLLGCVLLAAAGASDLAKEKRWADQIVDSLIDGEPEWLEAGGTAFLSIYTEADSSELGVIVLHGVGVHPNWDQVIYPLRTELVAHGWSTLSLQLPILANDATMEDYAPLIAEAGPRIKAGIEFLKHQGNKRVVVIGHSLGATMAAMFVADARPDIAGFIAVGLQIHRGDERYDVEPALRQIRVPVLDIYGSEDLERVLDTAKTRASAASANPRYTQVRVPGANHFFDDRNDVLVEKVAAWITALQR